MKLLVILFIVSLTGINCKRGGPDRNQLREIFYWDIINFDIPLNRYEQSIASGTYIPTKNGIHSIGVWQDKMFAGIFRFSKGVVSSLNYFSLNTTDKSPVLIPYPSFEANYINEDPNNLTVSLPSNESLINVGHFEIDKCDRLWVTDSGYTEHYGNRRTIAPQAIVIFDLISNTLLRRIEVPQQLLSPLSVLGQIVIDFDSDSCEDAYAYVSDAFTSIFVYSFKKDRTWQVSHNFMSSNPQEGNFVFENFNYQWIAGVYALAIGDQQSDGSKRVYFSPVSSTNLYYVSNRVLQDENYMLIKYYYDFHFLGETGTEGQTNQIVYDDKTGALFTTMFAAATIGCWNTRLPFKSVNHVHKLSTEFYPTDIDIDTRNNVWVVSHLAPYSVFGEFQVGVKNVRIFKETTAQAITDTNCKISKSKV